MAREIVWPLGEANSIPEYARIHGPILLRRAASGGRPFEWLYNPMAVTPHAGKFNELTVVYDCMDELSKFKFAPPELIGCERELLAADVVFTGRRKMHASKSRYNNNWE